MAEETDQEAEARRQLEEYQRQQAQLALEASRNQPNAIPPELPTPDMGVTTAAQLAQRGLPVGNTLLGQPTPQPQPGFYVNQVGENLGGVQTGQPKPQGAVGIQGVLSPDEETFWRANPNGAVVDYTTGNLVGLGNRQAGHQYSDSGTVQVNAGLGPPAIPFNQQERINTGLGPAAVAPQQQQELFSPQRQNFIPVPPVDPNLRGQMDNLQNQISQIDRQLPNASKNAIRKGQPSEYQNLLELRRTLSHSYGTLGAELDSQMHLNATATHQNEALNQKDAQRQADTAMMNEYGAIKSRPGTDEHAADVIRLRSKYGAYLSDKGEKFLIDRANTHEKEVAFQQRLKQLGQNPQVTGMHSGQLIYKVPPTLEQEASKQTQTELSKALAKHGVSPEQFAQRTKVEQGTFDKEGKFTGQEGGPHMRVTVGNSTFGLTSPQYESLNKIYPAAQPQQTAQPTAAPQTGLQVGATRPVGGKTYVWNGTRWEPQ